MSNYEEKVAKAIFEAVNERIESYRAEFLDKMTDQTKPHLMQEKIFSYNFGKMDRIGIIGPNGCGKSTLLKCIVGTITPDEGSVETGQTIKIGYFGQENEALDESKRVIDYIRDTAEFIRTTDGLTSASVMCDRLVTVVNRKMEGDDNL